MSDNKSQQEWTYDHFLCLVLLYASYADLEYTKDEKEHILSHVQPDTLKEVETAFDKLGDFEQLNLIMNTKSRFIKTSEDKAQVLHVLKNHFKSDGDYSKLESNLYQFLEKLLLEST